MYKFTQNWFLSSEIYQFIKKWIDPLKKQNILEIGSYEGQSSVFFADSFLDHPESTLMCVDPFLSMANNDHTNLLANNEEEHFLHNISICKNNEKIAFSKTTSDDFFDKNTETFDLIYVDGCHECDFILRDLENAFAVLREGGIMWMDDYLGGNQRIYPTIQQTMHQFLDKHPNEYVIIHRGYQLAIQKITIQPTIDNSKSSWQFTQSVRRSRFPMII
jgi:predicted O-methyltransferase YrrM